MKENHIQRVQIFIIFVSDAVQKGRITWEVFWMLLEWGQGRLIVPAPSRSAEDVWYKCQFIPFYDGRIFFIPVSN